MTFLNLDSLKEYYGNKAVRKAVNALVDALDGGNMPEVLWEEARNYNQALLMAAQVRADRADLLFRVWDTTFGQTTPSRLGEEYLHLERATPAAIWSEACVERFYYRDRRPVEENGPSDGLFVWLVPRTRRTIALGVERYSKGDDIAELPANPADVPKGWHVTGDMDGGDYYHFANNAVDMMEFLGDPCPALKRFRRDAVEMVNFLTQN